MPTGDPSRDPDRRSLSSKTYAELKRVARDILRGAGRANTVDATSLAHEAWGRLAQQTKDRWKSQSHFLTVAAQAMRQILVDRARRRNAQKRGGGRVRLSISVVELFRAPKEIDLLQFDDLVSRLAKLDPRQAQIVEMKFYGGFTTEQIAKALGISKSTVEDDWRHARAWLRAQLEDDEPGTRRSGPP